MENAERNLDLDPVAQTTIASEQVPVVDVGMFDKSEKYSETESVSHAISEACKTWGFFQVVNHGISTELIDSVWAHSRKFFSMSRSYKEAMLRSRENPWGYYNNELTKNQRDKKEVFDFTMPGIDPIYQAENRWPPNNSEFKSTMLEYFDQCSTLSLKLLEVFCSGLNLPAKHLHTDFEHTHTSFIRLNYYPVADPLAGSRVDHSPDADLGVHHHADAGALTLLLQDDVGGLQVHRNGLWHNIAPREGAIVVNTGDMMQVWSNDIYKAAIHRVMAMEVKDRFSIPFFFNPNVNTVAQPLTSTISAERPARYRPIQWSEFRGQRTDGDYANYGAEVQISQYRV